MATKGVRTPTDLAAFMRQGLGFAITGLFAGCVIDALFTQLHSSAKSNEAKLGLLVAQLFTSLIVLYVLWRALKKSKFGEHWQLTIPGLMFPAMYVGVQSNMFSVAQAFYK